MEKLRKEVFCGIDTRGWAVLNPFKIIDQAGLKLEIVLDVFLYKETCFGWSAFIDSAFNAGWNIERKINEWSNAVKDVHGQEFYDGWIILTSRKVERLIGKSPIGAGSSLENCGS